MSFFRFAMREQAFKDSFQLCKRCIRNHQIGHMFSQANQPVPLILAVRLLKNENKDASADDLCQSFQHKMSS